MKLKTEMHNLTLPRTYQGLCACGCGTYFTAFDKGQLRKYLNDTHKKRAHRAREKEFRTEAKVKLTPKGYVYLQAATDAQRELIWQELSADEQLLVCLVCETGITPERLIKAANLLWQAENIPF